ncbi:MAG: zf-HC2 domain-containing protein [Clostridia bacterium]|nr:zf-HC2 domain-containing protein [Clostridia bacterium]
MRCDQFEHLLHSWMDDTLTPEETTAMRAHADACPSCAELATTLREALALCADMGDEAEVPQAAAITWRQAVRAQAAGDRARRRFALPRWETWAGLAAGILVLIGGANLVRYGRLYLEPVNNAPHGSVPLVVFDKLPSDDFNVLPEMAESQMAVPEMEVPQADQTLAQRAVGLMPSESLSESEPLWQDEDADTGGHMNLADSEAFFAFEPEPVRTETPEEQAELAEEPLNRADAPAPVATLAFLRDAGIFLALCLPPAAIALCIARLYKRRKKARNRPKE